MAKPRVRIWSSDLKVTVTKLDILAHDLPMTMRETTHKLAEQILFDSDNVSPTVPEDTGDLRSTGRVEKVRGGWAVAYGGPAPNGKLVDYAAQVHDDLRARKYRRKGSGPKFVEAHYLRRTAEGAVQFDKAMLRSIKKLFGR